MKLFKDTYKWPVKPRVPLSQSGRRLRQETFLRLLVHITARGGSVKWSQGHSHATRHLSNISVGCLPFSFCYTSANNCNLVHIEQSILYWLCVCLNTNFKFIFGVSTFDCINIHCLSLKSALSMLSETFRSRYTYIWM